MQAYKLCIYIIELDIANAYHPEGSCLAEGRLQCQGSSAKLDLSSALHDVYMFLMFLFSFQFHHCLAQECYRIEPKSHPVLKSRTSGSLCLRKQFGDISGIAQSFDALALACLSLFSRYTASTPMSWFMEIQDVIRKHASEHIKEPFVKVHCETV